MTPLVVRALCVVFFVSGAAALVFETLWFRQAGLAFGSSAWASVLVLSSFMAGLALGNLLSAAFGTRIRRPVRFYALLETLVGLSGFALVWLLGGMGDWLAPLMRPLLAHAWLVNAVRFCIAFLLLLAPATAMGATLPVLVMALRLRDPSFGSVLGRLYGFNTIGAVVGAVAGETLLIGWFGVLGTGAAAAFLYLSAATVALALSRGARTAAAAATPAGIARIPARAWSLAAAAFVSGGILLALEVVWFRIMLLFAHPSSLTFAVMLAVVLTGIGSGGFAAGTWLRRQPRAYRHATLVAFLAGAVGVASYVAFPVVVAPYGVNSILEVRDIVWLSTCLMLPASFVSGLLFTLTGTALSESVAPDIQAAGLVTLFNTIGSALGSIAGGFVLLPWLGIEGSYFLLSALYVVAALLLLVADADAFSPARTALAASPGAAILAIALVAASVSEGRDYYQLAARRFESPHEIAEVRETRTGTLMYLNIQQPGESSYQRLVTGSFGMASNQIISRRYMKLFVYWPVALRPDPKSALLIGFGTGSSAKALTDTRSFERIDIADISQDVIEMGRRAFPDSGAYPISDPRVTVYIEDGRYLLQATEQRYDLITSEPPPPKFAGIDNLYSRDYFELVREHLTEGGINTHWLPVRFLTVGDTRAIIRGYCEAFPDCSLWTAAGSQWMLVGSREGSGWNASREAFEDQWRDPAVGPELRALGIERPAQLGAMFMADAEQLRDLVGDTPPLEDNFPRRLVEGYAGRADFATYAHWMDTDATRRRFEESSFIREAWPESIREETLAYFAYQRVINDLINTSGLSLERSMRELDTILDHSELRTLPRWLFFVRDNAGQVIEVDGPDGSTQRGIRALADRDFGRAATHFARAQEEGGGALPLYLRLYAVCHGGRRVEARALAAEARHQGFERVYPEVFLYLEEKCGLVAAASAAGS